MSDTGWTGDPYHEGASQPMAHLQGGMQEIHTQMPMDSEAMTNPRSAGTDNVQQTWNTTTLAPTPAPTGANDGAKAH
jgi:hypothetical protein